MDIALYLHAMTGLLVIIDPIGSALIFNSLTASSDQKHRNLMAVKSVIISGITLILFGNYGEALFSQLGIISIHCVYQVVYYCFTLRLL